MLPNKSVSAVFHSNPAKSYTKSDWPQKKKADFDVTAKGYINRKFSRNTQTGLPHYAALGGVTDELKRVAYDCNFLTSADLVNHTVAIRFFLVLDEADRMLITGLIRRILKLSCSRRQLLFFETMPPEIGLPLMLTHPKSVSRFNSLWMAHHNRLLHSYITPSAEKSKTMNSTP